MTRHLTKPAIAVFVAAALLAGAGAACSSKPQRSVQAFCDTFKTEAIRLHDKYQRAADTFGTQQDPLVGLLGAAGTIFGAQGDMVVLFDRLDQTAPSDIEPDVHAMRDAAKSSADATKKAITDPLGAIGSGLVTALQSSGSSHAVDSYLQSHCDLSFERNS